MATGANPLGDLVMRALMNRSAGGAPGVTGGPGGPGAAPGGGPEAGEAYAQQVSELKGADPGQMIAQLKKLKSIFAVMAVQNMERLPNVSGQIYKLIPQIDRVIKEAQQAANVSTAVRNPISMGAAQPPPAGGEGGGNAMPGMF